MVASPLDLRPALDPIFNLFGVSATVTVPGGSPVATVVVWSGSGAGVFPAPPAELQVTELRRRLAVRRDHVPTMPTGTEIVAPELKGGTPQTFKVESIEREDEQVFVVVLA